jgi:glutamyl-tRNA reductase
VTILAIGVQHTTGPLEVLERLTVNETDLPKLLHGLVSRTDIREAVVVSTCNRTEIYAVTERFHDAYADVRDALCEVGSLAPEDLHPHLFSHHDTAAISHLFSVAAGLDSAVLGESEIQGQLRRAWDAAREGGAAGPVLNGLFRHALEVGKRVRTETAIGRGTASVSHAAVEMAQDRLGSLDGTHVLVVGAGEVGEGVVTALAGAGAGSVTVLNRTVARGEALAQRVGASTGSLDELEDRLAVSDVVVTCLGAGATTITTDMVTSATQARAGRPVLMVDLGLPRDVDAAVGLLEAVTLLDLDDLRDWASRGLEARRAEMDRVWEIVVDERERYQVDATARQAAPLVSALRDRAERIRTEEIDRFRSRLEGLDEDQRDAVEALTRSMLAKLLHEPSVRLRAEAGTPRGDRHAAAVRDLFDLD